TADEGGRVVLWDGRAGTPRAVLQEHAGSVGALAWSADGRWLATAGGDRIVRVWSALEEQ
ncbi:MAG: hypothetical protein KDK70_10795, partial [Myxococcales bacterium]|nr:hypothetical protein [Myxococcales bacterium]